jgi:hypothetical protein
MAQSRSIAPCCSLGASYEPAPARSVGTNSGCDRFSHQEAVKGALAQAPPPGQRTPRTARRPTPADQHRGRHHRRRPGTGLAPGPAAHRDGVPARRRPRTTPHDLDIEQCLIRLREEDDTERWQPISPTQMRSLLRHHQERGHGDTTGPLLRYRCRYDYLWNRLGRHLPWARSGKRLFRSVDLGHIHGEGVEDDHRKIRG